MPGPVGIFCQYGIAMQFYNFPEIITIEFRPVCSQEIHNFFIGGVGYSQILITQGPEFPVGVLARAGILVYHIPGYHQVNPSVITCTDHFHTPDPFPVPRIAVPLPGAGSFGKLDLFGACIRDLLPDLSF